MNNPSRIDVHTRSTCLARAPIEVCWSVITDHASLGSPNSLVQSCVVSSPGKSSPNGLGAIRVLHGDNLPKEGVAEVINMFWEPNIMGYRMIPVEGGTLFDHQAFVQLEERDGGTQITYHLSTNIREGIVEGDPTPIIKADMDGMVAKYARLSEELFAARNGSAAGKS